MIINNILPWNGDSLGTYSFDVIKHNWKQDDITYYGLLLSGVHNGMVYCIVPKTADLLPCIIDDIRPIFGMERRGVHRITLGSKEYVIYYVPVDVAGNILVETPLRDLPNKDPLRKEEDFKLKVQRLILFCDILALDRTNEGQIRIRRGLTNQIYLVNWNDNNKHYDKMQLTKTLTNKWLLECNIKTIIKGMIKFTSGNNLPVILFEIRSKIEAIIHKYDSKYIWYSYFIMERLSQYLIS